MGYKLLDLFCGAGGAAMGYHRAGFEVVGVDIKPQPHYPFKFIQDDALIYLMLHWFEYDAVHASPPCYENTWAARRWIKGLVAYDKQDRLEETRSLLLDIKELPFVLENTPGADMKNYIKLAGTMFGLKVLRERWFELHGFDILLLPSPVLPKAPIASGQYQTVAGHGGDSKDCRLITWREAMGIDWMTKRELTQAIPPAYTEYIGKYLIDYLDSLKITKQNTKEA